MNTRGRRNRSRAGRSENDGSADAEEDDARVSFEENENNLHFDNQDEEIFEGDGFFRSANDDESKAETVRRRPNPSEPIPKRTLTKEPMRNKFQRVAAEYFTDVASKMGTTDRDIKHISKLIKGTSIGQAKPLDERYLGKLKREIDEVFSMRDKKARKKAWTKWMNEFPMRFCAFPIDDLINSEDSEIPTEFYPVESDDSEYENNDGARHVRQRQHQNHRVLATSRSKQSKGYEEDGINSGYTDPDGDALEYPRRSEKPIPLKSILKKRKDREDRDEDDEDLFPNGFVPSTRGGFLPVVKTVNVFTDTVLDRKTLGKAANELRSLKANRANPKLDELMSKSQLQELAFLLDAEQVEVDDNDDHVTIIERLQAKLSVDGTGFIDAVKAIELKPLMDKNFAAVYMHDVFNVCNNYNMHIKQIEQSIQTALIKYFDTTLFKKVKSFESFCLQIHDKVFVKQKKPTTIYDFLQSFYRSTKELLRTYTEAQKIGMSFGPSNRKATTVADDDPPKKKKKDKHKTNKAQSHREVTETEQKAGWECYKCGHFDTCTAQKCYYAGHPSLNKEQKPWPQSTNGKAFASLPDESHRRDKLPARYKLSDDKSKSIRLTDKEFEELKKKRKGKIATEQAEKAVLNYLNGDKSFNPLVSARLDDDQEIGQGILDSGSFGYIGNYINEDTYQRFKDSKLIATCSCPKAQICTIQGCFVHNTDCITLPLLLYNASGRRQYITMVARVVRGLPYAFIVGLETMRRFRLTRTFDDIFEAPPSVVLTKEDQSGESAARRLTKSRSKVTVTETRLTKDGHISRPIDGKDNSSSVTDDIQSLNRISSAPAQRYKHDDSSNHPMTNCNKCKVGHTIYCLKCSGAGTSPGISSQHLNSAAETCEAGGSSASYPDLANQWENTNKSINFGRERAIYERLGLQSFCFTSSDSVDQMRKIPKEEVLDVEDDDDQIDQFIKESPYDDIINGKVSDGMDPIDKIVYIGEPEKAEQFKTMFSKYRDILRTELPSEPARIKPFELELESTNSWLEGKANKLPPRLQSQKKLVATREFTKYALASELIEPSQAPSWSQVVLTPKKSGDWRFCVDFKNLNASSKKLGWPLPHIQQVIQRLGARKAKKFAVIDLLQGYYQMPISAKSRSLTAFRTAEGLFQWKRLPMGLKGAGPAYQAAMQNEVLSDLNYTICEIYIDDCIVFADTEEELLENLDRVLARFKKFNICINPAKIKVGMSSVEYLGYKIDSEGVTFSREKIDDVLKFPKPITQKDMKSLLGVCQQFGNHIRDYSNITAPMHSMIGKYSPHQKLNWTRETEESYRKLLHNVNECPKLFFLDEEAEVFLHTDASNYGIGGYLYQVTKEGTRQPIRFVSKTLTKTEMKWSTPEKEAYAIFYSFMKLDYLLRDIHFTVKTDHKNLTFINTDFREKVKRWKLAIQHYDFDLQYIKGSENIEADGFSRLCDQQDTQFLAILTEKLMNKTEKTLDQAVYKKIAKAHNAFIGHGGVDRTISKLTESGEYWSSMRKDVTKYIRQCPCCQKMSTLKIPIHTTPFTLASYYPMDRLAVDTIGPIDIPGSIDENKYILVIIDAFSRFTRLYAIPDTKAINAANCLLDWIGTFGIPSGIVSDNGTQFANELVTQIYDMMDIEDLKIHAYSKEENGIVERANKEVKRHLEAIVFHKKLKSKWQRFLPLVQRIMNASVHSTLGFSPAQILFGNSVRLDRQLLPDKNIPEERLPEYKEYVTDMLKAQQIILQTAEKNQRESDQFNIAARGGKSITEFPINSYVLVNYEGEHHRPPSKLHTFLRGPLRVVNFNGPIYTLQNLVTNKMEDFHVKLLHPFRFDTATVDPALIAQHDDDYYEIIEVINHRFMDKSNKNCTNLEFLVKYRDAKEHVWQSWNVDFAANEVIHSYLNDNFLRRCIPQKYTYPKDHPEYEPPKKRPKKFQEEGESSHIKRPKKRKFGRY